MIDKKLSEYFAAMGRKSAKVRMKTVSARRRKQIAQNAAKARWSKRDRPEKEKRELGRKP